MIYSNAELIDTLAPLIGAELLAEIEVCLDRLEQQNFTEGYRQGFDAAVIQTKFKLGAYDESTK